MKATKSAAFSAEVECHDDRAEVDENKEKCKLDESDGKCSLWCILHERGIRSSWQQAYGTKSAHRAEVQRQRHALAAVKETATCRSIKLN